MLVLNEVSRLVEEKPQAFITGDKELVDVALAATKYLFDLSLQQESAARSSVADLIRAYEPSTRPVTRSQAKTAKERSPTPVEKTDNEIWKCTPIDSLLLDGMEDDQIWAQLELRTANLCETLENMLENGILTDEDELGEDVDLDAEGDEDEEEEDLDFDGFANSDIGFGDEEDEDEDEDESVELDQDEDEDEDEDEKNFPEEIATLHDPSDEETADEDTSGEDDEDIMDLDKPPTSNRKLSSTIISPQRSSKNGGHPILDDGFFSLAEFKAEIERAEAKHVSIGHLNDEDDDEDEDIESDIDVFAPVDNTTFDEEDLDAGEPYYKDFFAPPKGSKPSSKSKLTRKKVPIPKPKEGLVRFNDEVKVRKIKRTGKGISVKALDESYEEDEDEDEDEDAEEEEGLDDDDDGSDDDDDDEGSESGEDEGRDAIERFKDDLFADDDEDMPSRNVSSHESRQAEMAAQIKDLEAENVAPKPWTLMGEATTRSRPVDSLLEEDLEFDRVMKAVPVITEESVSSLEDMIKRRILENKFDDVVRKRAVEDKPFLPSRLFELDDKKSSKGLAEIYEDEYSAAASGTSTDVRDKKLQEQHTEITEMWEKICYKLDALSNAHFTPKPPKATITTISNVATATLESALPTTVASTTMLAPEEIYAPGTSALRSKEEMTPLEKKSLRNKQRKLRRKAQDMIKRATEKGSGKKPFGTSIKKEKEKALKSIVKVGKGVSVIGKQNKQKQKEIHGSKTLKL